MLALTASIHKIMKNNKMSTRISFKCQVAAGALLETLAVDILGAKKILKDPGLTVYQLPDNTLLEIYGNGSFLPQKIFDKGNVVLSLQVKDIDISIKKMLSAGARTMDGIIRTCETYAYCHLMLGDGQIVGLHQVD